MYSVIWTGLAQDTHARWFENWNSDPNLLMALIHWPQPVKENGEEGGGEEEEWYINDLLVIWVV